MTSNWHTPNVFGYELTAANDNAPLGELDSAITALIGSSNGNINLTLGAFSSKTIASGAIDITKSYAVVDTEGGAASDNLDNINGTSIGQIGVILPASDARTIVIRHLAGGTGNIRTPSGGDITLDSLNKGVIFINRSNAIYILGYVGDSGGGGGGAPNYSAGAIKTLASDVIAAGTDRNLIVASESGATDDLIEVTGLTVGDVVLLRADSGNTITVKHNDAGATIKIILYGDADVVLDEDNPLVLRYVDTNILAQDFDADSGGGGSITVEEADGTPSVTGVDTIVVSNGTLTDDGGGQVTIATGGGGGAPTSAEYVVMSLDGTLTDERTLAASRGIALSDGGAGNDASLTSNFGSGVIKTLSSDVAAVGDDRNVIIAAESGATDDLIEVTGMAVGETVWLRADSGDTITVKHNDAGATIKILLFGDADVDLDEDNPLILRYVDTNILAQQLDQNSGGGGGGLYTSLAILRDEQASGTNGGSSSVAAWTARDLNTEVSDPNNIVSIASNQFTPIAGDYEIVATAPCRGVERTRLRLYNVTAAGAVDEGISSYADDADGGALPRIVTEFTANGTDAYRIDHYTQVAVANVGLGVAASTGNPEVFLTIELRKLS